MTSAGLSSRLEVHAGWATTAIVLLLLPAPPARGGELSDLSVWDDGLSEMCYYDATDTVYGTKRHYTRVHLFNRQWMDPATGVKTEPDSPGAVPAFKLLIAEQIPTDNYNYRYLTTVFLRRSDLTPLKMTSSSQEWCGHTFKHLRWTDDRLDVQSFSYFPDEGDRTYQRVADAVPFESLFVLARNVVSTGRTRRLQLLPSMRSNRQVVPDAAAATLVPDSMTKRVTVPLGTFEVRRVQLQSDRLSAWFDVEVDAPHRIIAFEAGRLAGRLQSFERRAYWDQRWGSAVYPRGSAP